MATALAIASLLFVALSFLAYIAEIRHLQHQNRSLGSQNIGQAMQVISAIFLERPHLRACFYDGALPPREPEDVFRVVVISDMFVDLMSLTLNNTTLLENDEVEGWRNYFAELMSTSPALRNFWKQKRSWYEKPLCDLLDPVCARFPEVLDGEHSVGDGAVGERATGPRSENEAERGD